jgi:hypothetical protein
VTAHIEPTAISPLLSSRGGALRRRRPGPTRAFDSDAGVTLVFTLLIGALGCPGDAGDDAGETIDAGDDGGTVACTVALDDDDGAVALSAGATATFAVSGDEGQLTVTAPSSFIASIDGEMLVVTAPTLLDASGTLVVLRDCGGATSTVELALSVRPVAFTQLPTWTPGTNGPPGREYFAMRTDPVRPDNLIVHGGFHYEPEQFTIAWDSWIFSFVDETWTSAQQIGAPPQTGGASLAVIAGDTNAYLYGGIGEEGENFILPFTLSKVQIGPDSLRFTAVNPTGAPATGDYQPAFFYDAPRGRLIAVGGQGVSGFHMDVKAFDPASEAWASVAVAAGDAPTGRNGFFWVYDDVTERFVVFSGEQGGPDWACNCAEDTWALSLDEDPPVWREIVAADAPPGRRNGTFALDPLSHRMLIWGGTSDGQTTQPGLFALNLDEGNETWVELPTTGDAPIRSSGAMVFDAPRARMVVGFGNDSIVGAHEDLWGVDIRPRD